MTVPLREAKSGEKRRRENKKRCEGRYAKRKGVIPQERERDAKSRIGDLYLHAHVLHKTRRHCLIICATY